MTTFKKHVGPLRRWIRKFGNFTRVMELKNKKFCSRVVFHLAGWIYQHIHVTLGVAEASSSNVQKSRSVQVLQRKNLSFLCNILLIRLKCYYLVENNEAKLEVMDLLSLFEVLLVSWQDRYVMRSGGSTDGASLGLVGQRPLSHVCVLVLFLELI